MANRFLCESHGNQGYQRERGRGRGHCLPHVCAAAGRTGWEKEMDEWNDIQRSYMKSKTKTLADLFK